MQSRKEHAIYLTADFHCLLKDFDFSFEQKYSISYFKGLLFSSDLTKIEFFNAVICFRRLDCSENKKHQVKSFPHFKIGPRYKVSSPL